MTAAITNVDACEDYPDRANLINAFGLKNVAHAVKQNDGKLIYISTDFIFDGSRGNYSKTDTPNPLSIYGKIKLPKLQGEQFILDEGVRACICRTSVLYGWPDAGQRDNFFSWAYNNSLSERKILSIIDGQITTPILIDDLAECIYWMRDFKNSEIFHTAGLEAITRLAFVQKIFTEMKLDLLPNVEKVERITFLKQKA